MTTTITLFSLLPQNCNFATVMSGNANIWYAGCIFTVTNWSKAVVTHRLRNADPGEALAWTPEGKRSASLQPFGTELHLWTSSDSEHVLSALTPSTFLEAHFWPLSSKKSSVLGIKWGLTSVKGHLPQNQPSSPKAATHCLLRTLTLSLTDKDSTGLSPAPSRVRLA